MKATIVLRSYVSCSLLFNRFVDVLKIPLILFGFAVLSACSDSSDRNRISAEIAKPEGVWQEHSCEMAIPEGLSENDFTCGTFTVPADWDNPDDETVGFEVAVLRAKNTPSQSDPFVFLGGGPGAWNLEGYLYREAGSVLSPIAEMRDIVFFDKRGNGLSDPSLFCPEYYEQTVQRNSVVADSSEGVDILLIGFEKCHIRLAGEGIPLSHFNSYQTANDLASLMDVLGYEAYNLFGISHGTKEAQVMMRDHPEKIRSVIMDSTILPGDQAPAWAPNFVRSYELLFASCAASDACAASYPDLEGTLTDLVIQLNEIPYYSQIIQDDGTVLDVYITGDRFVEGIAGTLHRADLLPVIPLVIYSTAEGNTSLLDAFVPQLVPTGRSDVGLRASTHCAQEVPFSSIEEARKRKEGLNPVLAEPVYQGSSRILYDVCKFWEVTPRPDSEINPIVSDIPALIFAGEYDPATPPSNGEKVAETLSNSQYFLFKGLSHGILRAPSSEAGEVSCAMKMALQFLDDPYAVVDGACASQLPGPFD